MKTDTIYRVSLKTVGLIAGMLLFVMMLMRTGQDVYATQNFISGTDNMINTNMNGEASGEEERVTEMFQQPIQGLVTDVETGETLPGVNIVVKGTTIGAASNNAGQFQIDAPTLEDTLIFSYIGYLELEVPIDGRSEINVEMIPIAIYGEELVVVGYGTQRAANITGSIARISAADVAKVATPTVTQSLQGQAPGVFIKNMNAQPGQNSSTINIRGFGTPLFIVDGIPVSQRVFEELDPNDIEELNVLKDAASAAAYGARAGNGVIIVQTKRGRETPPQFSYKSEIATQYFLPHAIPDVVSSVEYLEMYNVVEESKGNPPRYSSEMIENYRQHLGGSDPVNFPNSNAYEAVLKNYAPMTQHTLNVRGGTESVSYFLSGGWFGQKGMLRSDDMRFNRYNLRSNLDVSLTERLSLGLDLSLTTRDYIGPDGELDGGLGLRLRRWRPFYSLEMLPDGRYRGYGTTENPLALSHIDEIGYDKWNAYYGDVKTSMSYELPYGFHTRAVFNYSQNNFSQKSYKRRSEQYSYNLATDVYSLERVSNSNPQLRQRNDETQEVNFQYFLESDHTFARNHQLRGMLVYEYLSDTYGRIDAWREGYEIDMDQLFAGPAGSQFNDSRARVDGRVGYIGRLSYNYAGRYSLETTTRVDASPRFPSDTRWGVFPSVSAAWTISEESFMRDSQAMDFVTNLRLRASYGRLGYDAIGDFQYLSTYSFGSQYIYDNSLVRGISADRMPNHRITWEKMDVRNIGIYFNLWSRAFEGEIDLYQRDRFDVLGSRIRDIPAVVGAAMPTENYREFRNRGWEIMLRHTRLIARGGSFSIGGNFSYNREFTIFTDEPAFANKELERRNSRIDRWSDEVWLLPTDGLFTSQDEIDNWADIDGRSNATIQVGDVRFIDTNGDGRITAEDMIVVGSGHLRGRSPRMSYGINTSANWRGFDFFMAWQGAGLFGYSLYESGTGNELHAAFRSDGVPLAHHRDDSYIPEGQDWRPPNTNARWPRLVDSESYRASPSYRSSEFWWINGQYLRLRQVQIGYALPPNIVNALGMHGFRVYASGYNLLTFSELDFMDPEMDEGASRQGYYYPQTGTFHLGIELNF